MPNYVLDATTKCNQGHTSRSFSYLKGEEGREGNREGERERGREKGRGEKERERNRMREYLSFSSSLLKWLPQPGLEWLKAETKSFI